ncbi:unnamed protein product [marine sediment metagenome]|uniref:MTTase N-terminal domain-containing protein n=1 Tax=marine sediment metagenome TaxID=412755 RepID=X1CIY7_9ZZZZ
MRLNHKYTTDVLCVGAGTYDLVYSVDHHPEPDEKIRASSFAGCGGGPAANAAVTVSRLGLQSASFQSSFEEQGLTVSPFNKPADIYVINTCAVTAKAAAQSRQLIRRAQRTNPQAKIVVTGCYAQITPEKIKEIETSPILKGGATLFFTTLTLVRLPKAS